MTCNDAYTCAIPCAIVEVVSKNFESLLVVIAKYKISMCVSVSVPSFMSKAVNFVVNHVFDVVEWDKAAYQVAALRNKPSEKAELFNNYFYEQFSGPSNYNTHINCSNNQVFDIDFNRNRVHKHLSNINSNKSSEPDGIHGKILKNCSESLAYPLSLILKLSKVKRKFIFCNIYTNE